MERNDETKEAIEMKDVNTYKTTPPPQSSTDKRSSGVTINGIRLRNKKTNKSNENSNRLSKTQSVCSYQNVRFSKDVSGFSRDSVAATYKLLIIGDSGVGKTSILTRFCDNTFISNYIDTIGVEFKTKMIKLKSSVFNNQTNTNGNKSRSARHSSFLGDNSSSSKDSMYIKLQMWDTAGQDKHFNLTQHYYRGAHGIFVVYDVTDRKSFENVKTWMKRITEHGSTNPEIYLIGNKCDIKSSVIVDGNNVQMCQPQRERQVSFLEGENTAKAYGIKYLETSAKAAFNVEDAFIKIVKDIKTKLDEKRIETAAKQAEENKRNSKYQLKSIQINHNSKECTSKSNNTPTTTTTTKFKQQKIYLGCFVF